MGIKIEVQILRITINSKNATCTSWTFPLQTIMDSQYWPPSAPDPTAQVCLQVSLLRSLFCPQERHKKLTWLQPSIVVPYLYKKKKSPFPSMLWGSREYIQLFLLFQLKANKSNRLLHLQGNPLHSVNKWCWKPRFFIHCAQEVEWWYGRKHLDTLPPGPIQAFTGERGKAKFTYCLSHWTFLSKLASSFNNLWQYICLELELH